MEDTQALWAFSCFLQAQWLWILFVAFPSYKKQVEKKKERGTRLRTAILLSLSLVADISL